MFFQRGSRSSTEREREYFSAEKYLVPVKKHTQHFLSKDSFFLFRCKLSLLLFASMFGLSKKTKLPETITQRKKMSARKAKSLHRDGSGIKPIAITKTKNTATITLSYFAWWYGLLWLVFASVALYALFFAPFLRVDVIEISGTIDLAPLSIEIEVHNQLALKRWGIVAQDNILLAPASRIETDILAHFKKIKTVSVQKKLPHTLMISVSERPTLLSWCVSDEKCFLIDDDGVAYEKRDALQEVSAGELQVNDRSQQDVTEGDGVISSDTARFANGIRVHLEQQSKVIIEMQATTPSRFSDEIEVKSQDGWSILFNTKLDPQKVAQDLAALLKKEISSDQQSKLKYIDMRTENRAYYSVDGESVPLPIPSSDAPPSAKSTTQSIPLPPTKNLAK
jgi:cell division septal protein FtsQ